jgi:hypothetical protein
MVDTTGWTTRQIAVHDQLHAAIRDHARRTTERFEGFAQELDHCQAMIAACGDGLTLDQMCATIMAALKDDLAEDCDG